MGIHNDGRLGSSFRTGSTVPASVHSSVRLLLMAFLVVVAPSNCFLNNNCPQKSTCFLHKERQTSPCLSHLLSRKGRNRIKLKLSKLEEQGDYSDTVIGANSRARHDKVGLYVHIPYCRRRCRYCNFAILPIGPKAQTETQPSEVTDPTTQGFLNMDLSYRESILQEINILRQKAPQTPVVLESIYFGGGTPSLAPLETIQSILDSLLLPVAADNRGEPLFALTPQAEVSIEMDPGTFSLQKLTALKKMGFNRISLGVQSFDDKILESIGRIHRRQDVMESIDMIQTVFGQSNLHDRVDSINYSIDLISGLPGLSLAQWTETLSTAVSLKPRPCHISLYDLQIEHGTVFGKWYGKDEDNVDDKSSLPSQDTRGSAPTISSQLSTSTSSNYLPSEDDSAFMYKYAAGYLREKGYEHYEVSSYAYVGDVENKRATDNQLSPADFQRRNRSRHNQIYWDVDGQWHALGLGATSLVDGIMTARPRTLAEYRVWVQELSKTQQENFPNHDEKMDKDDFLTDVILKRLRTSDGLDLNWVEQNYGEDCLNAIMKGASLGLELGLMTVEESSAGTDSQKTLRLVDPGGFLYSNNLISNIFVELGEEYYDS